MKTLTVRDGLPIVGRAVAEDNSGVVVEKRTGYVTTYEVRCAYPIDQDGDTLIYTKTFNDKPAALQFLKDVTGYSHFEKYGPDA